MKTLITILFTLFVFSSLVGQNCNCPTNNISGADKPSKVFKFSNGKTLGLCGGSETKNKEKVYSEFIIFKCGLDTSILEFDGTQSCTVEQNKDTLIIQEFYNIANNKNLTLKWTKFYVTKLYWKSKKLIRESYYKKDLTKYTSVEIENVLKEFKASNKRFSGDKILLLGHRLFWAYVSDSKLAGQYLEKLEDKFGGFDGAIAEEYEDLIATYQHYKTK